MGRQIYYVANQGNYKEKKRVCWKYNDPWGYACLTSQQFQLREFLLLVRIYHLQKHREYRQTVRIESIPGFHSLDYPNQLLYQVLELDEWSRSIPVCFSIPRWWWASLLDSFLHNILLVTNWESVLLLVSKDPPSWCHSFC